MEDENKVEEQDQENAQGESNPEDDNEGEELTAEQIEDLRKKAEVSSQNYERAKKAEEELKKLREKSAPKKEKEPSKESSRLSDEDLIYLAKADIHDDDLPDVRVYAEKMGTSIKEAHQFLTPVLEKKAEERKAAAASNTGKQARGSAKVDPEAVLAGARQGKLPEEGDDAGIEALVDAHIGSKQQKRK